MARGVIYSSLLLSYEQIIDMPMKEPYTIALTSCGRFDLLEKTLASLISHLDSPPEKMLVAEDSGDRGVEDILNLFRSRDFPIEAIVNPEHIGQVRSIDLLYSRIETDWVFHCEDDWEFVDSGFLDKSYALMKRYDSCSTVVLCEDAVIHADSTTAEVFSNIAFFVWKKQSPYGFTFQPSLKRMRDYRIVGPYSLISRKMNEVNVGLAYKKLGYRLLMLERPYMRHLGGVDT